MGLETFTKCTKQLSRWGEMGRDRDKLPNRAVSKTVGFYFACCAWRNLNIYPVCLAMEPAEGDISHL